MGSLEDEEVLENKGWSTRSRVHVKRHSGGFLAEEGQNGEGCHKVGGSLPLAEVLLLESMMSYETSGSGKTPTLWEVGVVTKRHH